MSTRINHSVVGESTVSGAGTTTVVQCDCAELDVPPKNCVLEVECEMFGRSAGGTTFVMKRRRRYTVDDDGDVTAETDPGTLVSEIPLGLAGIGSACNNSAKVLRGQYTNILGQDVAVVCYMRIRSSPFEP